MNIQNADGDTELMVNIINSDIQSCFVYIDKIEKLGLTNFLDIQNNLHQTALHLAVICREFQLAKRLIETGATVTLQDSKGRTPLHIACERGDYNMIECFWFKLEELNEIRDYEGRTFIHYLVCGNFTYLLEYVIGFGAAINVKDGKRGMTPLHFASIMGKTHVVAYLLSRLDIEVNPVNFELKTPLDYAKNEAIRKLLEIKGGENGAKTMECHDIIDCKSVCSICQEDTKLVQTECCSQVFHQSCLKNWQRQSSSCPLCRKMIYTKVCDKFVKNS